MSDRRSTTHSILSPERPATRTGAIATIVAFSLGATSLGAVVAAGIWLAADVRYLFVFVIVRWIAVLLVLLAPLIHRNLPGRRTRRLPYALQTPVTALVLSVESIGFDIIAAQLH